MPPAESAAQLVEDLAAATSNAKRSPCAEPLGQLADDLASRAAPRRAAATACADADDAALGAGHRALVLLVQRAGQDEIGVARRLGEEEVDGDEEVEALERRAREGGVGQRHHRD